MAKMKLLTVTLAATFLVTLALGWWVLGEGQESTQASPAVTLGVDANPSGNGATSLGSIDSCISVSNGTTFDIDLFVTDVTELLAWDIYFTFDPSVVNVVGRDATMFLAANAGSNVFDLSDAVPDSSGRYRAGAVDMECIPETPGPCESGPGVLARLTLQAVGPGVSPAILPLYLGLGLGPTLVDVEGQHLGDVNGDNLYDGPVSNAWIAVDQECPSEPPPTPTPWTTPSPTPSAGPNPTASPTLTPPPTTTPGPTATPPPPSPSVSWRYSCYLGASQPTEDALGEVSGDVVAAYRLRPGQGYDRWLRDRADLSTMTTLDPYDALFLLISGDATWDQQPPDTPPTSADLVFGWNSVCYAGPSKDIEAATAGIVERFAVVYALAPEQTWQRFVPGRPEVSNLSRLEPSTSVLILVTAEGEVTWVFDP